MTRPVPSGPEFYSVRKLDIWTVEAVQARALGAGGKLKSIGVVEWDISSRCQSPIPLELVGRPSQLGKKFVGVGRGLGRPTAYVDLYVRCRHCSACLKARAALWRSRAVMETRAATRTWFGTLTLSAAEQQLALARARVRAAHQRLDFDALPAEDQFARRVRAIGPAITRWLKRVRKRSGARVRYLLVAEKHASGDPHFHVLVHQIGDAAIVSWRDVASTWVIGFSNFKLVTQDHQVFYACKYLAKDAAARVRASLLYGRAVPDPTPSGIAKRRPDPESKRGSAPDRKVGPARLVED